MKCYYCRKTVPLNDAKHGLHKECFAEYFNIKNPTQDFENITLKQASSGPIKSDIGGINSSFFHGAFKKYAAEIDDKHYILKVVQSDFPELPLIEWMSNHIAKIMGIHVADFYLIRLENKKITFVTRNFISSKKSGSNLIHIYHFLEKDDQYNCENLLKIIKEKCGKLSDIKEVIYMCLFDALIGNHDRHGRNIALIQTGPSQYSLSPVYDNPSYIGIEEEFLLEADLNPKGKIHTLLSTEPSLIDYVNEFSRLGYKEICDEFIFKLTKEWGSILKVINEPELSAKRKNAFLKILEKKKKELELE